MCHSVCGGAQYQRNDEWRRSCLQVVGGDGVTSLSMVGSNKAETCWDAKIICESVWGAI